MGSTGGRVERVAVSGKRLSRVSFVADIRSDREDMFEKSNKGA